LADEEVKGLSNSQLYRRLDRPRRLYVRFYCNEAHVSDVQQTPTIAVEEKGSLDVRRGTK